MGRQMKIHLLDGTYELFRHYFAVPASRNAKGQEIAAVRGVLASVLSMLERESTHIGVATDHVIESFRNDLYPYYKTSAGIPADLLSQFDLLEAALVSMGVYVWPMVEFEADDALAAAAHKASQDPAVEQVVICTPDKDLSQCVVGSRVVQLDRRQNLLRDEDGVIAKFGVRPPSIPDYLALVGDTADGYPGLPGWGAKASASVLSVYEHIESIPKDPSQWPATIRGATKLCATLSAQWKDALIFKTLATLRLDAPSFEQIDDLRWTAPSDTFEEMCAELQAPDLVRRAAAVTDRQ